jgi:ketosteroid isomerase-like protein
LALSLVLCGAVGNVHAQQADVAAAIHETLAAWAEGRFDDFVSFYHADAHGFYLDGGARAGTFNVEALQAAKSAGFSAALTISDLEVHVYGSTSVAAGYLSGTLTLPGGTTLPGTWRYTETRIREAGIWKVVQFHFSPMNAPLAPRG